MLIAKLLDHPKYGERFKGMLGARTLIIFGAEWCNGFKEARGVIKGLQLHTVKRVFITEDEEPEIVHLAGIVAFPTLMLFEGETPVKLEAFPKGVSELRVIAFIS